MLTRGNVHRFAAKEGLVIRQWWSGPKQEVMISPGGARRRREPSGPPIHLHVAYSVEFVVLLTAAVTHIKGNIHQ